MYRGKRISVIIPCFNEEAGIGAVLMQMPSFIDEVIVVDNNSTDRTTAVAASFGATILTESRQGYGFAYQRGLPHASGEIIVALDGDGTYPVDAIARLIDHLDHAGVDFVSASRFPLATPHAMRWRNRVGNRVLTLTMRLLFRVEIQDSQSGMWVFRRQCLDIMRPTSGGMVFSQEIKLDALMAVRFAEVHIPYRPRIGETKLASLRDGAKNLVYLFRRRLPFRHANDQPDTCSTGDRREDMQAVISSKIAHTTHDLGKR